MLESAYDLDMRGMESVLQGLPLDEQPAYAQKIHDRAQMLRAGATRCECGWWCSTGEHETRSCWNKRLQELDSYLRLRWDFQLGYYVVDRYVRPERAWAPVLFWCNEVGEPRGLSGQLLELLRENDMQRVGAREWLRKKREAAAKKQAALRKAGNEALLAAIEQLSNARVKQFVDVERAIQSGERVILHGSDLRFVERAAMRTPLLPPLPGRAWNPGMRFDRLIRRRR